MTQQKCIDNLKCLCENGNQGTISTFDFKGNVNRFIEKAEKQGLSFVSVNSDILTFKEDL